MTTDSNPGAPLSPSAYPTVGCPGSPSVSPFKQLAAAYARVCYRVDRRCAREQRRTRERAEVTCFLLTGRRLPEVP